MRFTILNRARSLYFLPLPLRRHFQGFCCFSQLSLRVCSLLFQLPQPKSASYFTAAHGAIPSIAPVKTLRRAALPK